MWNYCNNLFKNDFSFSDLLRGDVVGLLLFDVNVGHHFCPQKLEKMRFLGLGWKLRA
jgi:hypothetical protein